MTVAEPFDALLLASYGGPEGPDEVMPFLERATAGRGIPAQRLLEVGQHYFALGGVSPINAQNRALVAALADELTGRGIALPVYLANRNSKPLFDDVLRTLVEDGRTRVLALTTSAYSSYSGCRQYREDLAGALADAGIDLSVQVFKLRPYSDRAGFIEPTAGRLREALSGLAADGTAPGDIHVFFTTHSIPDSMALASGPDRSPSPVDSLYVQQHLRAATRVVELIEGEIGRRIEWSVAYQSRSGPPHVPWLEPDIGDALRGAARNGTRTVIIVPIGFISDHVEVVWDLDTQARQMAEDLGLTFIRVATPGTHPAFVAALVDLVEEAVAGAPLDHDEPWSRLCSDSCCLNGRVQRPAVLGC